MDAGNGTRRAVSEINVTPLIDVLLVLLIIFMMIQPAKQSGLNSQIPQPSKPGAATPPSTVVVEVSPGADSQPVYKINEKPFARSEVTGELRAIFASRSDRTIFVKGDAALTYRDVAEVVDMGHRAGVQNIALMRPGAEAGR
ncbi:MAG TPA: biopolymer transporter ExbD [Acidobacteriaceae bacterium]|nr:biopolymer transporter ExbD [Acidobacteriaceae bacterium]